METKVLTFDSAEKLSECLNSDRIFRLQIVSISESTYYDKSEKKYRQNYTLVLDVTQDYEELSKMYRQVMNK